MVEKPPKLIFKENYGEPMDFGYPIILMASSCLKQDVSMIIILAMNVKICCPNKIHKSIVFVPQKAPRQHPLANVA
jgi:hypothetical protein